MHATFPFASLPGLTRQSTTFGKCILRQEMDARVKPAHDGAAEGERTR
jgi:hypothetical protein